MRRAQSSRPESEVFGTILEYQVLNSFVEPAFNDIVTLLGRLTQSACAVLVFRSDEAPGFRVQSISGCKAEDVLRDTAFLSAAMAGNGMLATADAGADERFANHLPGPEGRPFRFLAGIPIKGENGVAFGALAILDFEARKIPIEQAEVLRHFAGKVIDLLEMRRQAQSIRAGDLRTAARMGWDLSREQVLRAARTLDAVSGHIAMLSGDGTVVYVNRAWRRFADENQLRIPDYCLGTNYLDVCEAAAGEDREVALKVAETIRAVLRGDLNFGQLEYPCHGPAEERWFVVDITGFEHAGARYAVTSHQNVTSLKRIQRALAASEQKFRAVMETAQIGLLVCNGEILHVNPEMERITGYRSEELLKMKLGDVAAPEFRERADRLQQQLSFVVEYPPQRFELRIVTKEGREKWLDCAAAVTTFEGKRALVIAALDDTERKAGEQAMRATLAKLNLIGRQIPAALWTADQELRIQPSFGEPIDSRLAGYAGKTLYEAFGTSDPEFPPIAAHLAALEGKEGTYETTLEDRLYTVRVEPFRDEAGKITGCLGLSLDITEQKAQQEELRRTSETLRAVIEAAPLAVFAVNTDCVVESWNPAAEQMLGWRATEVVGRRLTDLSGIDVSDLRRICEMNSRGHGLSGMEWRCPRRSGEELDMSVWTAPLRSAGGEKTGAIVLLADISERKRWEERFIQAQKMEAVGRLAGGVAHDFNNLLTAIIGYTQLAAERMLPTDPNRNAMAEVKKAADRAASLTSQLLSFGRRQLLQPSKVNLNQIISGMDLILRSLAGSRVQLILELEPDLESTRVDVGHIEQVIVSLITNAKDAIEGSGRIFIRTRNLDLQEGRDEGYPDLAPGVYVSLSVTDSGRGMEPEVMKHVFEPFFTTKAVGKGTGLGLSTAYGIAKQSGGEILVESVPGNGTTFTVLLPVSTGREPSGKSGSGTSESER